MANKENDMPKLSDTIRRPAFAVWGDGILHSMINHKYSPFDVHELPPSVANLDSLTEFYKFKFEGLSRNEQSMLYTIVALNANCLLGHKVSVQSLTTEDARQARDNLVGGKD